MTVVFTGGRTNHLTTFDLKYLDTLLRTKFITEAVVGGAIGIDSEVEEYLRGKVPIKVFEAKWKDFSKPYKIEYNDYGAYNSLAGHNRNRAMLLYAKKFDSCLIAFTGGSGTANCISQAKRMKITTYLR